MFKLPSDKPSRLHTIDAIRGIAAVCVMLFHNLEQAGLTVEHDSSLFENAWTAVDLFFVISGYVLPYSYGRYFSAGMSMSRYLAVRLVRLYPCAALSVMLAGLWDFILSNVSGAHPVDRAFLVGIVQNVVLIPDVWHTDKTSIFKSNPPLWSVFFEIVASIYVFKYHLKSWKFHIKIASVCFAILMAMSFWRHAGGDTASIDWDVGWNTRSFLLGFPRTLFSFSIGYLIFVWSRDEVLLPQWAERLLRSRPAPYCCLLAVLVMLMLPWRASGLVSGLSIFAVIPVLVFCATRTMVDAKTDQRLFHFLGEISYPLYCFHWPIFQICNGVIRQVFPGRINLHSVHFVLMACAATVIVAWVLARRFDAPVRLRLRRLAI